MKTLKTLIATLFLLISYNAFADGTPAGKNPKNSRFAHAILPSLPVMFGSPEDINYETVELLKNIGLNRPESDTAGSNSEGKKFVPVAWKSAGKFTFPAPEMNWGSPEDVYTESIRSLKYLNFPAPEMKWGSAEDLNSESVKALKYLNFPAPEMSWGSPEDVNLESVKSLKSR